MVDTRPPSLPTMYEERQLLVDEPTLCAVTCHRIVQVWPSLCQAGRQASKQSSDRPNSLEQAGLQTSFSFSRSQHACIPFIHHGDDDYDDDGHPSQNLPVCLSKLGLVNARHRPSPRQTALPCLALPCLGLTCSKLRAQMGDCTPRIVHLVVEFALAHGSAEPGKELGPRVGAESSRVGSG
jgi:hypothetical protein